MAARVGAWVGILVCLLSSGLVGVAPAGAVADDYAHSVDQIVAALRQDPVLVQETLGGGDTAGAHDRLSARARRLPFATYVALVEPPTDLQAGYEVSEVLAATLHRRIGKPGLYIVSVAGVGWDQEAFAVDLDAALLGLASSTALTAVNRLIGGSGENAEARVSPETEAEIVLRNAAQPGINDYDYSRSKPLLAPGTISAIAEQPWTREDRTTDFIDVEDSQTGKRFMVGTTVGLAVTLILQQTLRGPWPGWKRRRGRRQAPPARRTAKRERLLPAVPVPLDITAVRREANSTLTRLAEGLARLPVQTRHPEIVEDAVAAREAAESLVDSTRVTDVVGALVLGRSGERDLDRATRAKPGAAYRCCFFNPLHGPAVTEAAWEFGDADIEAPVCSSCAATVRAGREPDLLRTRPGHGSPAYYEGDDVWARTGFGSLVDHFGSVVLADRAERA
ncbi:MAG: hypothetical protein ABIR34_06775 [Marmoricola sp.]